jgi:hypothetical protein
MYIKRANHYHNHPIRIQLCINYRLSVNAALSIRAEYHIMARSHIRTQNTYWPYARIYMQYMCECKVNHPRAHMEKDIRKRYSMYLV